MTNPQTGWFAARCRSCRRRVVMSAPFGINAAEERHVRCADCGTINACPPTMSLDDPLPSGHGRRPPDARHSMVVSRDRALAFDGEGSQ